MELETKPNVQLTLTPNSDGALLIEMQDNTTADTYWVAGVASALAYICVYRQDILEDIFDTVAAYSSSSKDLN